MRFLFIAIITQFCVTGFAQNDTAHTANDTLAPYQKSPIIPIFSLLQPDSTWYFNANLDTRKPLLLLYFSPDCGHCQLETEDIIANLSKLKNLQILMVTSRPYADMKAFATKYKLDKFPSIKIGTDPAYKITRFYKVESTPFSALYNKKGKLVKVYRKGIDMEELIGLVK